MRIPSTSFARLRLEPRDRQSGPRCARWSGGWGLGACLALAACGEPVGDEAVAREIRTPVGEATAHPEVCDIDSVGCSGTLLAPNVVLTAGHCISQEKMWRVHCPYASDTATVTAHEASSPPSWPRNVNPDSLDMNGGDDVALIHLDQPIKGTRFGKVNLGSFADGSPVYAIGRVDDGKYGTTLWVSKQMTVSGQDTAHRFWVAVDFSVGQSGDSGGPLILTDTQEIIGVDSLGGSCGSKKLCEVFGMVGGDPGWFTATFAQYTGSTPVGRSDAGSTERPDAESPVGEKKDADTADQRRSAAPDADEVLVDAGETADASPPNPPPSGRPDASPTPPGTTGETDPPRTPAAHNKAGCSCDTGGPAKNSPAGLLGIIVGAAILGRRWPRKLLAGN